MPNATPLALLVTLLLWAGLLASIAWAGLQGPLGAGFAAVTAAPWGVVTLLDLYGGLLFVAAWIAALERDWRRVLPWVVALLLLGNLATTGVYLLLRLRRAESVRAALLTPRA